MKVWLLASCLVGAAHAETLCCGRGAKPMGERSAVPLEARASPWGADLVFGLAGAAPEQVVPAVRSVAGVTHVEARPRWLRVWGPPSLVRDVGHAGGAVGARLVPAHEVRIRIEGAAEKGKLARAGKSLAHAPGVVDLEIESDGERAVARVWLEPGFSVPVPPAASRSP